MKEQSVVGADAGPDNADQPGAMEAVAVSTTCPTRFDVFLSHNSRDKPAVERIARRLKDAGLEPWLDAWYCTPGVDFHRDLATGLDASAACVIFVGPNNLGNWEWQELGVAQIRAANDPAFPLIPVLLPGLPEAFSNTHLPPFLRSRTWVDFRPGIDDPVAFERLLSGIRGSMPGLQLTAPRTPEPPVAGQRDTEVLDQGLNALADLMRAPAVRAAVDAFHADFAAACEQIVVLTAYKDLHDQLHELEFGCYRNFVDDAELAIEDERARRSLRHHGLALEGIVDELGRVVATGAVSPREQLWINKIIRAEELLRQVREEFDPAKLNECISLIGRVLDRQPTSINDRLVEAARALRLTALQEAMTHVTETLARQNLDPEKVRRVKDGRDALFRVSAELTALIADHDQWQMIDVELRQTHVTLEHDASVLESCWPDLQMLAQPLYGVSTELWARQLAGEAEKLDNAIAAQNPNRIREGFLSFRDRAGLRFFKVDKTLKHLCGELRSTGELLESMLRFMG
jgi:hypothetical protein